MTFLKMASNSIQCQDPVTCPGGNCPGCKNGQIWCQDTRCLGYCTNCLPDETTDRFGYSILFVIIIVLLLILFTIWITYGHQVAYYYVPNYQLEEKGYAVPQNASVYY